MSRGNEMRWNDEKKLDVWRRRLLREEKLKLYDKKVSFRTISKSPITSLKRQRWEKLTKTAKSEMSEWEWERWRYKQEKY